MYHILFWMQYFNRQSLDGLDLTQIQLLLWINVISMAKTCILEFKSRFGSNWNNWNECLIEQ